jgi:hypothetical protein
MKSVNGMLLIALAMFVLWIGVSGRFPKLMEAVGLIRGKPDAAPVAKPSAKDNASASNGSGGGSGSGKVYGSDILAQNIATMNKQYLNPLAWPILAGAEGFDLAKSAVTN